MSKTTFFDNVREWIGSIAFAVYLCSIRMTREEFWAEQDRQAREFITCTRCSVTIKDECYCGECWRDA